MKNSLMIVLTFVLVLGCTTPRSQVQAPIILPETVEHDPSLPVIEAAGYRFHGEIFGNSEAPTLIVIHGGPGADYHSLISLRTLADEYKIVFYDQRGAGLSPRVSAEEISFDGYLDDLGAIADLVSPERPVILLGHSFGGQLATAFTARNPERVVRLVLLEPGPLNQEMADNGPTTGFSLSLLRIGGEAGKATQRVTGPDDHAAEDFRMGYIAYRANPGYSCDPDRGENSISDEYLRFGTVAWQRISETMKESRRKQRDLTVGMEKFTGSTLILAGSCNSVIGPEFQERQAELLPNARVVTIEDAGHQLVLDQLETVVDEIRRFLD